MRGHMQLVHERAFVAMPEEMIRDLLRQIASNTDKADGDMVLKTKITISIGINGLRIRVFLFKSQKYLAKKV